MKIDYVYKIQHKKEKSFVISRVEEIQNQDRFDAYIVFKDLYNSKDDFTITQGWGLHISTLRSHYNITELSPENYPEYYI